MTGGLSSCLRKGVRDEGHRQLNPAYFVAGLISYLKSLWISHEVLQFVWQ